jgi:hypothetical protein
VFLRKIFLDPILCIYLSFFLSPRWGFFSVGSNLPIHPGRDVAAVVGCHPILHVDGISRISPSLPSLCLRAHLAMVSGGTGMVRDDVKAPQQGTAC